ncbi:hypothetical protein Tco_1301306 [Tanacetum coccineum]
MDDPNITMEEYIRLQEEKAHRQGKVYNWETATYGKIWDNEDVHDLGSVETEFTVIVFNDTLAFETTLSCEPTILKMDLENDMHSLPSPEPVVSCFDDLDFFNDFENKFPAIIYNDALTSKSDFLTEPVVSPQHIDEFNLKDETSLSECDEEEQNVLYFNDLFSFNVIYLDDSKSDKDNDDDKIDIKQSSGVIMEYLVNISKRRAFWSLNEDILKIMDSDYQYAVSIKEDTASHFTQHDSLSYYLLNLIVLPNPLDYIFGQVAQICSSTIWQPEYLSTSHERIETNLRTGSYKYGNPIRGGRSLASNADVMIMVKLRGEGNLLVMLLVKGWLVNLMKALVTTLAMMGENYDLRMLIAKEKHERLELTDHVARMERRQESREE